jgi:hypothetical protein
MMKIWHGSWADLGQDKHGINDLWAYHVWKCKSVPLCLTGIFCWLSVQKTRTNPSGILVRAELMSKQFNEIALTVDEFLYLTFFVHKNSHLRYPRHNLALDFI